MDKRLKVSKWGAAGTRVRTSPANWRKPFKWNRDAGRDGVRRRVFCASLADVFEERPELKPWRYELFELINETMNLDHLILTKRPENITGHLVEIRNHAKVRETSDLRFKGMRVIMDAWFAGDLVPNVWLGTSVENQESYDERLRHLIETPAAVRYLSMEPLLGPVKLDFNRYPVDWVIVGGESGPNARPMHPEWARSIRDQCQEAGVPFFFKQWGAWDLVRRTATKDHSGYQTHYDPRKSKRFGVLTPDGEWYEGATGWNGRSEDPDTHEAYMHKVGKRTAGRLLDGREWSEFPAVELWKALK